MIHEHLGEASKHLRKAADAADGEASDRFSNEAEALVDAAAEERSPDHGWLDRHTHVVRDAAGNAGEEAREHAEDAIEEINAHRENVPGV